MAAPLMNGNVTFGAWDSEPFEKRQRGMCQKPKRWFIKRNRRFKNRAHPGGGRGSSEEGTQANRAWPTWSSLLGDAKETAETSDSSLRQQFYSLVRFLDLATEDKEPPLFSREASKTTSEPFYCPREKFIPGFLQTAETSHSDQHRNQHERWPEEKDKHQKVFQALGTLRLATYDIKYDASAAKPAKVNCSSILDKEGSVSKNNKSKAGQAEK